MSTPSLHPTSPRPRAEVVIDLDAIRHNVGILAGCAAASGATTMAVVKADGYGHGAIDVAVAALQAGAGCLGVCSVDEALALRHAGIDAPVLSWLHTPGEDLAAAVLAGVDLAVYSTGQLDAVAAAAAATGRDARVHLKIDTGLTRGGASRDQWPGLVRAAVAARGIEVVAVWSHLAYADHPAHPVIDQQVRYFDEAYQLARDAGLRPLRHLANSAATLTRPDLHYDLVRPGIAVYGLSPVPGVDYQLLPAMTLRSQVAMVKRVPAGEGVSYGHVWHTDRETTLALVPAGYADGVPRALTGRLDVWLAGRRRPVVGRVCMDQVMVDCGDHPVAEGAEVVFFGAGDGGAPTAAEWANKLGTIHYEVVAGMVRPRLSRTVCGRRPFALGSAGAREPAGLGSVQLRAQVAR
ncbi:MAG: alanine racemase [Pseudonocardiaceae bacterium]